VAKHKFIIAIEAAGLDGMTQAEVASAVAFSLGVLNAEDDEDFEVELEGIQIWPMELHS